MASYIGRRKFLATLGGAAGLPHRSPRRAGLGGKRPRARTGICRARAEACRLIARHRRPLLRYKARSDRGAGGAIQAADNVSVPRLRRCRRADELRHQHQRWLPPSRCLHRPGPQRRQARRSADQQSIRLEFVINMKTVKALGISIPDKLSRSPTR
jgi:hypothetical protein